LSKTTLRTVIYVDGYNLYYGCLKYTGYKWLNIHALFADIANQQAPLSIVSDCRFYTAMVKGSVASHGEAAVQAQTCYHQALVSPHTPQVTIVNSWHDLDKRNLMRWEDGKAPNKSDRVTVWYMLEKQTDVRLALDAYRTSVRREIDQLILVSSDTDLAPLLESVRLDAPDVTIGCIMPRRESSSRPPTRSLEAHAHWTRHYIRDEELRKHQFANKVSTQKRPVFRPDYW